MLQPLDVLVHSVLSGQLVAAGEVVHSLVREERLEGVRFGVRAGPPDK